MTLRMAKMATTIIISTSVKPSCWVEVLFILLFAGNVRLKNDLGIGILTPCFGGNAVGNSTLSSFT